MTQAAPSPSLVQHILQRIDLGQLNPGDLLDEAELAETFGVSRTPVREAILYLEALGLVRRLPRKGATIFRPTLEEFLAILEVHAKLEGQAAGLAARRLSRQGASDLEAAVRACESHAAHSPDADPDGYYQLNLGFHACIAHASGNAILVDALKTNARKLLAYYRARYRFPGAIAGSAAEHRDIARLILDRNSEAAEARMQRHVQFDQVTAMDLLAALS
jgi:DNA-binding GntR family transcriptional regulator